MPSIRRIFKGHFHGFEVLYNNSTQETDFREDQKKVRGMFTVLFLIWNPAEFIGKILYVFFLLVTFF